ncbi:MAG: lipopolysaccharide heptosyltransferase II [Desulfobulbus propionicus]|nr:MAG: lipopolysaccharide heptosyltransferase II [Desulfobulbus propionicus]
MRPFPRNPQKILIRSTNWIGDAVMTTPAVRTIRENYPKSEIVLLALPWVSDIFSSSPHIDRIITYDKKGVHAGLCGKFRLVRELKAYRFDCAVLLQNAFEAALITTLSRIPARGGYTTDGRGLLLTHGVRKRSGISGRHQVYYYQEMLAGLGLIPAPDELELYIPAETRDHAMQLLAQKAEKDFSRMPLIGFNPGAAYGPAKRWPAEKFAALARRIEQQLGGNIAVFGTNADTDTAMAIKDAVKRDACVLDFTGKTTLLEAMALIGQCSVFVTNDSGLMHVAAALKVPLAAIFGSTDHVATGPFSANNIIIRKNLACSPCKETHCPEKHLQCLEQINVDEVMRAMQQLILQSTLS